MAYLNGPTCQARLRSCLLHAAPGTCPRCGAQLRTPRPRIAERFRGGAAKRRTVLNVSEWEGITRSQYNHRRYVSRPEADTPTGDSGAAPGVRTRRPRASGR
jgi:hypothetical protein